MNPAPAVKTNSSPVVFDKTTAREINFVVYFPVVLVSGRVSRFAPGHQHQLSTQPLLWLGRRRQHADRDARRRLAGVQDYPTFTKIFLELGDKALARHEMLKGAYYLRLAEFFLLTNDPRKLPTRQRFVDLLLGHFQIPSSACSRIPYGSGWLPAYRLTPAQPKGTLVVFGGFDSYIEEWLPAALVFRDAGYDTILFEGPGQGAALELAHLTMSPEWEKPVKAVLDFFRLDAVTLMGFSLGGGLVIRAAAFEPRVRRVIAYDIMTNGLECFLRPLPPPAQKELLDWIDTGNEGAIDKFFADAMAKSLLLDWMMKLAMHNTGV